MLQNDIRPAVYYCNPNITPYEEYSLRKEECSRFARSLGLDVIDADYDHAAWLCAVKGLENEPERGGRCLECFKYRLLDSARYALRNGYGLLTTTLASSRWKSLEQINRAGAWAVETALADAGFHPAGRPVLSAETGLPPVVEASAPLLWWERNWRKGGLQERRSALIKEYQFYNQTWCGCEFSRRG